MPTNLYGPNDNFDLASSHVLAAFIRKFVEAVDAGSSELTLWGSGAPLREFLHVDDLADACYFLLQNYNDEGLVNIGCGYDISIKELAELIVAEVGYEGKLVFDTTKPDGTPRKLMDTSKINNLGWSSKILLRNGIIATLEEIKYKF
jgi:GDP-L-fucose synthase